MLSRLDEPLGRDELMSLTGLPGERIDNILAFLEDKGLAISDTPSMLLAHVSRQPLVQRDSQLRNLLHRHPNMPAEAKRRGK